MQNFPFKSLPKIFLIRGNSEEERRSNIVDFKNEHIDTICLVEFIKKFSSNPLKENKLENEDSILKEELYNNFDVTPKNIEEYYIDFSKENSGLRRYIFHLLKKNDEEEEFDESSQEQENSIKDYL